MPRWWTGCWCCSNGIFVSPAIALVCGLLLTGLALVGSWFAFSLYGPALLPLSAIVAGTLTHFARDLVPVPGHRPREAGRSRRAFGQYLSPSLLHRIEHTPDAMRLGGDDRELTVMFVDVRNFTEISERLTPTAVVGFLNTLLDALSRHVIDNEGTLDKFIGDSIMAFWNAPVDVADHAAGGSGSPGDARDARRLNAGDAFGFGSRAQVGIGIGIHTGLACVGNMGAEARFNYSAVGDAVNVAARIESCCKEVGFDVLVSESTAASLTGFALLDAGARTSCAAARAATAPMRWSATPRPPRPPSRSRACPSVAARDVAGPRRRAEKGHQPGQGQALPLTPALGRNSIPASRGGPTTSPFRASRSSCRCAKPLNSNRTDRSLNPDSIAALLAEPLQGFPREQFIRPQVNTRPWPSSGTVASDLFRTRVIRR